MSSPRLEAFLMAEDIRFEGSGQFTLVGIFGERVFSKVWPLQLPKTCFHVRVRDVEDAPQHSLEVTRVEPKAVVARLDGTATAAQEALSVFNYFFAPGVPFERPGCYHARFALHEAESLIFESEYTFRLLVPNPDELYVECTKCKRKFGSNIVVRDAAQLSNCKSICPQCQTLNMVDAKNAFHLPNPE